MKFVSKRTRLEWHDPRLDALLKHILTDVSHYAFERWNWEFTITSIYRSREEDAALSASGIHSEWRAVDVRTRGQSAQAIEDVARYANDRWIYDDARPHMCVCFSEKHGTAPHAHFQVHANTRRTALPWCRMLPPPHPSPARAREGEI